MANEMSAGTTPLHRGEESPLFQKVGWTIAYGYFIVVFLLAAAGHTYFFNLNNVISLRGFSVVEYLAHSLEPLNFARDFPGGAYISGDKSIITNLYVPLKHLTGLPNEILLAFGICLEVLSVIAGATVLWLSLTASAAGELNKNTQLKRLIVCGWLVTVLVAGNVVKPNLSNFGAPFFHGQFYGFADALAFVALAAYFRKKWAIVTLALIAALAVHPIKALMPCFFIAAAVLANIRTDLNVKSLISGVCVALFAVYWAVFQLKLGGGTTGVPGIPDDLFIAYTRIQQYHWYPAVNGLVSWGQNAGLVPFFAVLTMVLIAALKAGLPQRTMSAFLVGFVALAMLTIWGLYNSIDLRSPFLIKLCLIRASEFMMQVSPFLICLAIYRTWRGRDWLWLSIFISFLLAGMWPNALPSFSLAFGAMMLFLAQNLSQRTSKAYVILPALVVMLFFILVQLVWWHFPTGANPLFNSTQAILLAAICYIGFKVLVTQRFLVFRSIVVAIAFNVAFLSGAYAWLRQNSNYQGDMDLGRSLYQAQKWASVSTKKTALFMVDPCLNYGWRDFSERSSIGTPREWYMTGWLYVSDFQVFTLGQDIGQTLGMDLAGMLPKRNEQAKFQAQEICYQAKSLFYDVSRAPLRRVQEKFNVDYFVMYREPSNVLVQKYAIKPAYANDHVRVFSAEEYLK